MFGRSLTELEGLHWAELEHAYGSAADVPEMLRRLASSNEEESGEAWEFLNSAILHQGDFYSATEAVLPFLIHLATTLPGQRSRLLDYLAFLTRYDALQEGFQQNVAAFVHLVADETDADVQSNLAVILAGCVGHGDADRALDRLLDAGVTPATRAIALLGLRARALPRCDAMIQQGRAAIERMAAALVVYEQAPEWRRKAELILIQLASDEQLHRQWEDQLLGDLAEQLAEAFADAAAPARMDLLRALRSASSVLEHWMLHLALGPPKTETVALSDEQKEVVRDVARAVHGVGGITSQFARDAFVEWGLPVDRHAIESLVGPLEPRKPWWRLW